MKILTGIHDEQILISSKIPFNENYEWVTSSIFSPMQAWSQLLEQIFQFYEEYKDEIICFQALINYKNGENIRIALLTSSQSKQQVGYRLNHRIKSFFSTISNDGIRKKVDSIFLPYPTNVIEFGLYNLHYDQNLFDTYIIREQISRFIVEVLKSENIDIETIITFCFYLQIGFTKTIFRYFTSEKDFITLLNNSQDKNENSIRGVSEENIDILTQITSEIIYCEVFESDLTWMNQWIIFCKDALKKYIKIHNEPTAGLQTDLFRFYQYFVMQIRFLLGISGESANFLHHAVTRCLSGFSKEN